MRTLLEGVPRRLRASSLALTLLFTALPVAAQTEEEIAGARSAATQGVKAYDAGDYAQAVDLFQRAESLVHAPPHLLYMARAHEKLGHLVTARELYNKIIRENLPPSAPQAFRDAQAAAEEEIRAVEPRLARLSVTVEVPAGVVPVVTMDGKAVPAALLGVARPVDPGEHVVEVKAEGYLPARRTAALGEGGTEALSFTLEVDPNAPMGPAAQAAVAEPAPVAMPAAMPEDTTPRSQSSGLRTPAYISLGVGAVGLGAGILFTLQSASKRSDADELYEECASRGVDGQCKAEDPLASDVASLDDEAGSAQTLAIVGYAVGGLGIAAGVTLLVLDHQSSASASEPRIVPWVGYRSAGVSGTF
ncbi:MAG TPA: hypothetical protein VFU02_20485 [Polyangiaceae bacterium]|nr:hypothetical protein [Polyangiaceae bacterium]